MNTTEEQSYEAGGGVPVRAHTPGPWYLDGTGIRTMVRGSDATIVALRHRLPSGTHEANASLIAAAPELLEALRYAIKQAPDLATVPRIAAAIAKATGEAA